MEEHEGCCSCHINPPCSYCTRDIDDEDGEDLTRPPTIDAYYQIYCYQPQRAVADLDGSKIDYISRGHSGCSMIKEGVYPPGTTEQQVRAVVNGTFGGRFEHFRDGKFKFIAHTD